MEQSFPAPTECDIIMEGGVTSGVVFPSFIAELSKSFAFRSIGGTSVGAVAAAAAAAAQFRRNAGGGAAGFNTLDKLPGKLQEPSTSGKSTLFSLFQPCPDLAKHFAILSTVLNRKSALSRFGYGLAAVIIRCWQASLLSLAICGAAYWFGQLSTGALIATAVVLLIVLPLVQCVVGGYRALSRNNFGMCSGMGTDPREPALTQWLHDLIQSIAFHTPGVDPLTFGNLAKSSPSITLAFMSTGLAERRAHRLPHHGDDLLFRRSALAALFPKAVLDYLCERGRAISSSSDASIALLRAADPQVGTEQADLYFLPPEEDLPIVFAARLSLSFPVLLQAVPLYRLRFMPGDGVSPGALQLAPIWLSDGGLSSNFPIHFFDALLPERPTFGVALENTLHKDALADQRVELPSTNRAGLVGSFQSVKNSKGEPSLWSFVAALLNTSRGWRDEALQHAPGYRDRIVHIRHTKEEGGLNLNMEKDAMERMRKSGILAAQQIVSRFGGTGTGWMNHRWVRARSTVAVLQDTLGPLVKTWHSNGQSPSYQAMWAGVLAGLPTGYPITQGYRQEGDAFWQTLQLGMAAYAAVPGHDERPQPHPTLEITPKSC